MLAIRPAESEYAPYYAAYISRVADGRLFETLEEQPTVLRALVSASDDDRAALPSARGKWSLKDTLNHITDAERVFALRLLWFARAPGSELPSFNQDAWVPTADAHRRSLADLCDEFDAVRHATLALLRSLPSEAAARQGESGGNPASVRALAWMIAGHAQHHIERLRQQPDPAA